MTYLLLEDSRVKGGYINKSVLLSAGCPPQGGTHLKRFRWKVGHLGTAYFYLPERMFWNIIRNQIMFRNY
jgi:hypothetical protein